MSTIRHRLSLAVYLVDTAKGKPIAGQFVQFFRNGERIRFTEKGGGIYYLTEEERYDFDLRVCIHGYEDKSIRIGYDSLNDNMPLVQINLLPEKGLTLKGNLPGITEIQAVSLDMHNCFTGSYDSRKKTLTFFNPHKVRMIHKHYGIIQKDLSFEPVTFIEDDETESVTLAAPLKSEFAVNAPVERIIFGETDAKGNYRLSVYDDGDKLNYLVRYVADGEEFFRSFEFHELPLNALTKEKKSNHPPGKETEVMD